MGEEPGAGRAPDPRARTDHDQRAGPESTDAVLTTLMGMREVRNYPHPENPEAHRARLRDGRRRRGRGVARRGAAGSAAGAAGRGRRASRRVPHAGRGIRCLGRAAEHTARAEQRQGRPLLVPQPLFPRAERHPVRDRLGRPGLRRRRADGQARREAGAAAVPRRAAQGDRGGAEGDCSYFFLSKTPRTPSRASGERAAA